MAETGNLPETLSFGIVPQQSTSKLAETWTPVLGYLGEKTGYRIIFNTAKDIPTFEQRCAAGEYDLAYMNPYEYTIFHKSPGYRVFSKEKLRALEGIIVVRKDSPYQDLKELAGQTFAFPSPVAFAASMLTRTHLSRLGIAFSPQYVSSHDSVYRSVAKGLYPAGGGVPRTLANMEPAVRDQLRILWTSRGYSPHAIAAHPRVPAEVVQRITRIMTVMEQDPAGKGLLEQIEFRGLVAAGDEEWDDVRALDLDRLE